MPSIELQAEDPGTLVSLKLEHIIFSQTNTKKKFSKKKCIVMNDHIMLTGANNILQLN